MKRFFCISTIFVLALAFSETVYALSVTLVKGPKPQFKSRALAGKPIVLTFGDEHVVIHETSSQVAGKLLTPGEVSLSELFLVGDHRVKAHGKGYQTIYSYKRYHLAIAQDPGQLDRRVQLTPIIRSEIIADKVEPKRAAPDPKVQKLISMLSSIQYGNFLDELADPDSSEEIATRYTCHDQAVQAAEYVEAEFKRLGLQTKLDGFPNDTDSRHAFGKWT